MIKPGEIKPGDLIQYDARHGAAGSRNKAKIALVLKIANEGNGCWAYCFIDKAKYYLVRSWITKKL